MNTVLGFVRRHSRLPHRKSTSKTVEENSTSNVFDSKHKSHSGNRKNRNSTRLMSITEGDTEEKDEEEEKEETKSTEFQNELHNLLNESLAKKRLNQANEKQEGQSSLSLEGHKKTTPISIPTRAKREVRFSPEVTQVSVRVSSPLKKHSFVPPTPPGPPPPLTNEEEPFHMSRRNSNNGVTVRKKSMPRVTSNMSETKNRELKPSSEGSSSPPTIPPRPRLIETTTPGPETTGPVSEEKKPLPPMLAVQETEMDEPYARIDNQAQNIQLNNSHLLNQDLTCLGQVDGLSPSNQNNDAYGANAVQFSYSSDANDDYVRICALSSLCRIYEYADSNQPPNHSYFNSKDSRITSKRSSHVPAVMLRSESLKQSSSYSSHMAATDSNSSAKCIAHLGNLTVAAPHTSATSTIIAIHRIQHWWRTLEKERRERMLGIRVGTIGRRNSSRSRTNKSTRSASTAKLSGESGKRSTLSSSSRSKTHSTASMPMKRVRSTPAKKKEALFGNPNGERRLSLGTMSNLFLPLPNVSKFTLKDVLALLNLYDQLDKGGQARLDLVRISGVLRQVLSCKTSFSNEKIQYIQALARRSIRQLNSVQKDRRERVSPWHFVQLIHRQYLASREPGPFCLHLAREIVGVGLPFRHIRSSKAYCQFRAQFHDSRTVLLKASEVAKLFVLFEQITQNVEKKQTSGSGLMIKSVNTKLFVDELSNIAENCGINENGDISLTRMRKELLFRLQSQVAVNMDQFVDLVEHDLGENGSSVGLDSLILWVAEKFSEPDTKTVLYATEP